MQTHNFSLLEARDVHKKYLFCSETTLNGISLTIPPGSMYGLLGPSGCGKTTLLRCIIGTTKIDSGVIRLSASKPQHIGFMPQELSLHEDFTIAELYRYYGTLHDMDSGALKSRSEMLSNLLEIPKVGRIIKQCSGGEKRRISLAITLIHDPSILILDEPTVGLDPLISLNISRYLRSLAADEKKTIIITTHYMEEARVLDTIGFMREGRLLCEDSPYSLMSSYNCQTLDQVFLHLIHQQDLSQPQSKAVEQKAHDRGNISHSYLTSLKNQPKLNWKHLSAQVYHNYRYILRNVGEPLVLMVLPAFLVFYLLYAMDVYRGPRKFGFINNEIEDYNCSNRNAVILEECSESPLYSCRYLDLLKDKLSLQEVDSVEKGIDLVKTGQLFGVLNFPVNFSTSINKRLSFRIRDSDETYQDQQLQVYMDNSRYAIASEAIIYFHKTLLMLGESICIECGIDQRLAYGFTVPLQPNIGVEGSTLYTSLMPGLIHAMFFFLIFMSTSVILGHQKSRGTLIRDQISGVTVLEIICSTVVLQVVVMHLQILGALFIHHFVFSQPNIGSYALIYFILLQNQIFGLLLGILVTLFVSAPVPVFFIGLALNVSTLFLDGTVWAVQGQHWLLKMFTTKIPLVMMVQAHMKVQLNGLTLSHPSVYEPIAYSTLLNILVVLFIYIKLKINNFLL